MDPRYEEIIEPLLDVIRTDSPAIFLKTFSTVPEPLGLLFAVVLTQFEVLNGGFAQFFWNGTGVLAPEAVRGFQVLGQPAVAGTVERAMAYFGTVYPRERAKRQRALPTPLYPSFDELDREFVEHLYSERGGFEAATDAYIDRFGISVPGDRS